MTPVWLDPVQTVGCEVKPDPAACCDLLTACWMEADSPPPKAEPIAFPAGQVNDTVTSTSTPLATSFADIHEWVHHDANHLRQAYANIEAYVWPQMGNTRNFSSG